MKHTLIRVLHPLWRLYKQFVLVPGYELLNTWTIWRLRNHHAITLQKKQPLPLTDITTRIVDDLRRDGVSIVHIDDLFPHTTWLHDLTAYGEGLKAQSFQNARKTYWREMWDITQFLVDTRNPFVRFALTDPILAVANAYMGMYVKFHSISLSESIPLPPGTPATHSQLWHRDIGNKKYVKALLYLNDVGEADGPFIYLKGSQPGGRWWHFFPQINPYTYTSGRVDDAAIAASAAAGDVLTCVGKAGTIVFADTTGLHKGGYATRHARFASIIGFYTHASLERKKHKDRFRYPDDFAEQLKTLSPQARYALTKKL